MTSAHDRRRRAPHARHWLRWVGWRTLQGLPSILGVVVLVFTLVHLAPGDPLILLAGEGGTPEYYAEVRARYGLDRPLVVQLIQYVILLASGQLGYSFVYQESVGAVIAERLPATLLLGGTALALALGLGVALGVVSVLAGRGGVDRTIRGVTTATYAVPVFFLGQLLLLAFAVRAEWFPVTGMTGAGETSSPAARLLDVLHHLTLPAVTLALSFSAVVARVSRTSLALEARQDYARAARARGLSWARVVTQHALPNALAPIASLTGHQVGILLTGAALTESVFAWPGLGRLLLEATLQRDYPLVLGIFLVVAATVVVANILTDLVYALLDPRVGIS